VNEMAGHVQGGDAPTPFLRMVGISKRFPGVVANHEVSLDVHRGEVHGLLGENGAGKTTLMNILTGLIQPDAGRIEIDGVEAPIRNPRVALSYGIGMVHQHFMLVPDMTVAENVALGIRSGRLPLSRVRDVASRLKDLSAQYGLKVDPRARIEDLSVGEQQRVELLKLLYKQADLLVLDEPTAVLTPSEWMELADALRSLVAEGRSVIFITHKLGELLSVADRCTVMRDGGVVATISVADADNRTLARMMVGRDVVLRVQRPVVDPGAPVLHVGDLVLEEAQRRPLDGVTFSVRGGEILGVAGVDGNGQRELVDVLTGLRAPTSGTISIKGTDVSLTSPRAFGELGGAVIPEDRRRMALALDLTLEENLMMRDFKLSPFSRFGVLSYGAMKARSGELISEFDIRTPNEMVRMRQLSGGNQQKAVLARELHGTPALVIASQPTRGLDVGATEYVHQRLLDHKKAGGALVLISADLDEVRSMSDRIAVMVRGRFVGILDVDEADEEVIGLLMAGETVSA
jgi:general nucleoside transport system ATP-binding protein